MKPTQTTALLLALLATGAVCAGQARPSPSGAAQTIMRAGSQPSIQGSAQTFTGAVEVDPLFPAGVPASFSGAVVSFDAGARSAWHTHPAGQYLIVTDGIGWTQQWGGPVEEIHKGDVV